LVETVNAEMTFFFLLPWSSSQGEPW